VEEDYIVHAFPKNLTMTKIKNLDERKRKIAKTK